MKNQSTIPLDIHPVIQKLYQMPLAPEQNSLQSLPLLIGLSKLFRLTLF